MLNIFPNLLTYTLIAPLILRLVLGVFMVFMSYKKIKFINGSWFDGDRIQKISNGSQIVLALSGILLIFGLFTQIASLLILTITLTAFLYKKQILKAVSEKDLMIHVFIMAISFSLMLSGAGFYAIDLPL